MAVGQHAVCAGKSIALPIWTQLQVIPFWCKKNERPQGGQVPCTDAAVAASDDCG